MKILMVCLGNICRSPLAEGIMREKLPENFTVDSAGTISMHEGENPDKRATKIAKNHGIDISKLKSRLITTEDFEKFDIIYCMDVKNLQNVISIAPNDEAKSKAKLILEEAGNHASAEVEDPYFGDEEGFEKCYQILDKACEVLAKKLTEKSE